MSIGRNLCGFRLEGGAQSKDVPTVKLSQIADNLSPRQPSPTKGPVWGSSPYVLGDSATV